jgi:hypothetical protein
MSPRDRVAQLYPQALDSLFVAFYGSQDYGGDVNGFHTGLIRPSQVQILPSELSRFHQSIYLSIYLSMALQPFVGPWPLFQFLDLLHSR